MSFSISISLFVTLKIKMFTLYFPHHYIIEIGMQVYELVQQSGNPLSVGLFIHYI